jgi:hypothetical protein
MVVLVLPDFKAFNVFISSYQREFETLRSDLKEKIDDVDLHDQQIMNAITIENEYGPVIMDRITAKLEESSIYVGIFGRQASEWAFAEFRAARSRQIPTLIYYYRRPLRRGRPRAQQRRGRPSMVLGFLRKEVRPWIDIHGLDRPYTSAAQLIADILDHLAMQTAQMVEEAARVRKAIHRASVIV